MATSSPMLAASLPCIKKAKALGRSPTEDEMMADLKKLDFSVGFLGSPKIDGIRGFVKDGVVLSRTWKPIPNKNVQALFGRPEFNGLDGELTLTHYENLVSYNDNQSAIMTADGPLDIHFNVFDKYTGVNTARFFHRTDLAKETVEHADIYGLNYVPHKLILKLEDLLEDEEAAVIKGFEGYMGRHRHGLYKMGRSTFIEQGLFKLKRFEDFEAEIIGFVELQRNQNEATIDARGFQVRSSHKAGKVGADTLGLFQVRGLGDIEGIEFECGSGLDDATRAKVWANKEEYLGQIIKGKSQPHGVKEKPRSPIWLGFRSKDDM